MDIREQDIAGQENSSNGNWKLNKHKIKNVSKAQLG